MTDPVEKMRSLENAVKWREALRREGKKLVVTNGCFDLLHHGHVHYLFQSRTEGDALLVLVNSDEAVRRLKGPTRPVNHAEDRAYVLCGLEAVDCTVIFDSERCDKELAAIAPDVYVKGGDYTVESLDRDERAALQSVGALIVFKSFVQGFSTTSILARSKE